MKSAILVPTFAFGLLLAGQAFAQSQAQAPKAKAMVMQPKAPSDSPVQPALVAGQGYGTITTPGLTNGEVLAHLYDQDGTRLYTLKGDLVTTLICFAHGAPQVQQSFYGELTAPGETLQVEGVWMISRSGVGRLAAVIFGAGESDEAGPKIGRIDGFFQVPTQAQQVQGNGMLGASIAPLGQPRSARSTILIVDPLKEGALVDHAMLSVQVPLTLRWSMAN